MASTYWNCLGIAACFGLLGVSCSSSKTTSVPSPQDEFDRNALLLSIGTNTVLPVLEDFLDRSTALEAATDAYAEGVTSTNAASLRLATQDAWRAAMVAWQHAEVLQIGPAAGPSLPGGLGIRDEIYSWPTVSSCRVDQETVAERFGDSDFFATELVNVYGLDALEYLLFVSSDGNACATHIDINSNGTWANLGVPEIRRRRADYAAAVARDVRVQAARLLEAWTPAGGDFLFQLTSAGAGSTVYATAQSAIDDVFRAMFYFELRTKDEKIGVPAGLDPACGSASCPNAVESPYAGHSLENVRANFDAFRALYFGAQLPPPPGQPVTIVGERVGFDTFLTSLGAEELSQTLEEDLAQVETRLNAINGTLSEAIVSDLSSVQSLFASVKAVSDTIKSQFVSVLNLKIPDEGAGDND
jgi:uncharacterized protein